MTKVLSLVQVLLCDEKPKILLLDETRGAIDSGHVRNLEEVLDRYLKDTSIIEICHPEQTINPKTHPFFTHVLNLNQYIPARERGNTPINTPMKTPDVVRNIIQKKHHSESNFQPIQKKLGYVDDLNRGLSKLNLNNQR
jgi:ABC-type Mn2+/Zn2+ transport system ATPase subunit